MRKDALSESARLAEISKHLRNTLNLWGYQEVFLPTIESYDDQLDKGTRFAYKNEFYLIKPDLTSQIVANHGGQDDMRLFYISEVLDGGVRGDWQFGIEKIGGSDGHLQVEVLSILLSSLKALRIDDFYLDVGSLKVWEKAIGGIEEYRKDILTALYRRNFDLIEELALPRDKKQELWSLFNFRGEETDYEKLSRIVARLDSERVFVDYGTLRPLPYYEDLVFEVYSPRYGQPVGAGGEYTLNGNKACGFAFDMDALVEIFDGEVDGNRRPVNLEDDHPYRSARKLVQEGTAIEVRT